MHEMGGEAGSLYRHSLRPASYYQASTRAGLLPGDFLRRWWLRQRVWWRLRRWLLMVIGFCGGGPRRLDCVPTAGLSSNVLTSVRNAATGLPNTAKDSPGRFFGSYFTWEIHRPSLTFWTPLQSYH
jgi:hypothetical protein